MGAVMTQIYTHTVVGMFSPQNGCFSEDGCQLFVVPFYDVPVRDTVGHEFSSIKDPKIKSRFGWVKETRPFSIDDLICQIPVYLDRDERLVEHLNSMVRIAQKLKPDDAVAVDYMRRGVEIQKMELSIHKVFFQKPPLG